MSASAQHYNSLIKTQKFSTKKSQATPNLPAKHPRNISYTYPMKYTETRFPQIFPSFFVLPFQIGLGLGTALGASSILTLANSGTTTFNVSKKLGTRKSRFDNPDFVSPPTTHTRTIRNNRLTRKRLLSSSYGCPQPLRRGRARKSFAAYQYSRLLRKKPSRAHCARSILRWGIILSHRVRQLFRARVVDVRKLMTSPGNGSV